MAGNPKNGFHNQIFWGAKLQFSFLWRGKPLGQEQYFNYSGKAYTDDISDRDNTEFSMFFGMHLGMTE